MRPLALLAPLLLAACVGIYADPDRTVLLTPLGPVTQTHDATLADGHEAP